MATRLELPALDGSGAFISASVRQAIADSAEVGAKIDAKVSAMDTSLRSFYDPKITELNSKIAANHGWVTNNPNAQTDKSFGRMVYHQPSATMYISDGTAFVPLGGRRTITPGAFCVLPSGTTYDMSSAPYVYVDGAEVTFRFRLSTTTSITHGRVMLTIGAMYLPRGIGVTPATALTSGGSQSAANTGAAINANGAVTAITPTTGANSMEIYGKYEIPFQYPPE